MAEGRKAADDTKGALKDLNSASEGLRKNINSFADNLLSGSKTTGTTTSSTTGSGFSRDAETAGASLRQGVDDLGNKLDKSMNKK